jgi:uncharacterized protein YfaS (alpha-2-macroglobulin family)
VRSVADDLRRVEITIAKSRAERWRRHDDITFSVDLRALFGPARNEILQVATG